MIDNLLAMVAPHSCSGCGEVGTVLCDGCKYDIISEPFGACVNCLRPMFDSNLCANCTYFGANSLWCIGYRDATLKALLDNYKFESMRGISDALIELLDVTIPPLPKGCLVGVIPTTPAHIRERGFDHMERIGRGFAAIRGLTYTPLLRRTGSGTQHFKSKREREQAAREAFEPLKLESGATVLLIDDILTTGSTLRAGLDVLRRNGAEMLYGAIIARQPLDDSADLW